MLGHTQSNGRGFTLIELIIVIVILGILAVTAAPKFLDLTGDANEGVLSALAGSMKSTASIYNGRALTTDGGLENGFESEGVLFDRGYPIALDYDAVGDTLSGQGPELTPEILEAMDLTLTDWTFNYITLDSEDSQRTRGLYITSSSVIDNGATAAQIIATDCYVSYESFVLVERAPAVKVFTDGCN